MSGLSGISTDIANISTTLTNISNDTTSIDGYLPTIETTLNGIETNTGSIDSDTTTIASNTTLILADTTSIQVDIASILSAIESIVPYNDVNDYDDFSTAIDLIDDSYDGYQMARRLLVLDAGVGTQVLEMITGAGETRTLTVSTGDDFPATNITDITTNTTVSKVRIWW